MNKTLGPTGSTGPGPCPTGAINPPKKMHEIRNILLDANEIVNADRPEKYGPVVESFDKIGDLVSAMLNETERYCLKSGKVLGSVIIKTQIATKLVRNGYSPDNSDHLADGCGYMALLDQYELFVSIQNGTYKHSELKQDQGTLRRVVSEMGLSSSGQTGSVGEDSLDKAYCAELDKYITSEQFERLSKCIMSYADDILRPTGTVLVLDAAVMNILGDMKFTIYNDLKAKTPRETRDTSQIFTGENMMAQCIKTRDTSRFIVAFLNPSQ